MQELTLTLSERAEARLLEMGKEFEIVVGQLGSGNAATNLAMGRIGAPEESARQTFTELKKGALTIWAPDDVTFIKNEVVIDLYGVARMVLPLALSAVVVQSSEHSCASCGGDCSCCR